MATLIIPVRSDFKAYDMQVDLEGTVYTLDFGFNTRSNRWYMSIYNQAKTNLIVGDLPILVNVPLIDQYVDEALPPGRFIALNEAQYGIEATSENFGNEVKLFYEESA